MLETIQRFFVLMVDDDQEDVYSMRRAIENVDPAVSFEAVSRGRDFFARLAEKDPSSEAGWGPDVVLLDLNLPIVSGYDVLKRLRRSDPMSMTPVVVLTTSDSPADALRCYQLGANVVFTKATSFAATVTLARAILSFWRTPGIMRSK